MVILNIIHLLITIKLLILLVRFNKKINDMTNNMNNEDYFIEFDRIRFKLRIYAIISIIMSLIKLIIS